MTVPCGGGGEVEEPAAERGIWRPDCDGLKEAADGGPCNWF